MYGLLYQYKLYLHNIIYEYLLYRCQYQVIIRICTESVYEIEMLQNQVMHFTNVWFVRGSYINQAIIFTGNCFAAADDHNGFDCTPRGSPKEDKDRDECIKLAKLKRIGQSFLLVCLRDIQFRHKHPESSLSLLAASYPLISCCWPL